jgi:hypothetical protein
LIRRIDWSRKEINGWTLLAGPQTRFDSPVWTLVARKGFKRISICRIQHAPKLFGCRINGISAQALRMAHPVGVQDGEFEYRVCISDHCMFSTDKLEAALDRAFQRIEDDANV